MYLNHCVSFYWNVLTLCSPVLIYSWYFFAHVSKVVINPALCCSKYNIWLGGVWVGNMPRRLTECAPFIWSLVLWAFCLSQQKPLARTTAVYSDTFDGTETRRHFLNQQNPVVLYLGGCFRYFKNLICCWIACGLSR